jgi:hypothetical protein
MMKPNMIFSAVVVLCCALPSAAFELTGFKWNQTVPYEVNAASSQELGRETTLSLIADSYASWRAPNCSDFTYSYEGETNDDYQTGDQINTLVWRYEGSSFPRELGGASTIGVTLSSAYGGRAIDGDIVFNGIDHTWVIGANRFGEVDAQSIITHEVGHQLGLDHSPYQSATMYAAYLGGDGSASLSSDDISGVCNLYPSDAQAECSNDDDCPGSEVCSGGSCVPGATNDAGGIGAACGQNNPCENGLFCVVDQRGNAFCTRQCGDGCPMGWSCQQVSFGQQRASICLEDENDAVGTGEFGDPCNGGYNCGSGFCVSDGDDSFCSQSCRDDADCPEGAECYPLSNGGGACVPSDSSPMPDPEEPMEADAGVGPSTDMGTSEGPDSGDVTGTFGDGGVMFPDTELTAEAGCDGCDQNGSRPMSALLLMLCSLGVWSRRRW